MRARWCLRGAEQNDCTVVQCSAVQCRLRTGIKRSSVGLLPWPEGFELARASKSWAVDLCPQEHRECYVVAISAAASVARHVEVDVNCMREIQRNEAEMTVKLLVYTRGKACGMQQASTQRPATRRRSDWSILVASCHCTIVLYQVGRVA